MGGDDASGLTAVSCGKYLVVVCLKNGTEKICNAAVVLDDEDAVTYFHRDTGFLNLPHSGFAGSAVRFGSGAVFPLVQVSRGRSKLMTAPPCFPFCACMSP